MTVRLDSAALLLCDLSGWTISNLQLQKLLYLAQVEHAFANDGDRLVSEGFQAWDYGPVIPSLYRRLKMFGAADVENVFRDARTIRYGSPSDRSIRETWAQFGDATPGELIEFTHWDRGGWANKYEPGIRDIPIAQADIVDEANARRNYREEWRAITAFAPVPC